MIDQVQEFEGSGDSYGTYSNNGGMNFLNGTSDWFSEIGNVCEMFLSDFIDSLESTIFQGILEYEMEKSNSSGN